MAEKSTNLHRYVYRVLTLRLALATVLLCALLAAVAYLSLRDQVSNSVLETAENRLNQLRARTLEIMQETGKSPEEAFHAALDSLVATRLKQELGGFIYTRIYTPEGRLLSELKDEAGADLPQHYSPLQAPPSHFPAAEPWLQVVRIDGRPHIHLVAPIQGIKRAIGAYAEGIFALSAEAIAQQRATLFRTIGWVVLIVLITATILYPVIIKLTRRLAGYSEELLESHLETVQILGSAIAKRDSDTSAHNYRVTIMAIRVAEALGLTQNDIKRLVIGAFLHDVGKIGIRDEILLKPGQLDEGEYEVMKTHVGHGVDIISGTEWLRNENPEHVTVGKELLAKSSWLAAANKVVANHHEKYDGSGYPAGLAAEQIPLEARIFSVVDVFDALTCKRPYKQPFSFEKSMAILEEGRGSHFDPKVLDAFGRLAAEFHAQIAGREDSQLQDELDALANRFFYAGLETLEY